ncbi:hypothetical protein TNCV_3922911 [Trichonephila clavipes]|nr:hypothetical protein TNCV_3922911 [Trichonephila clavipes]
MAASSKTPPHQSKGPQKFKTPLQVPVFPVSSLLCRHTSCEKTNRLNFIPLSPGLPQDFVARSGGSRVESKEVKIARERRVRENMRVSPCQKITRAPRDCDARTHLKKHVGVQCLRLPQTLEEEEELNINVALFSYTRAFGDGPRNFEPWSSDVDDT